MNVLLLNPPFHPKYSRSQRSPAVIKSGVIYYPIWLAYAAGVLEKNNFDVRLIDAPAEGYDLEVVIKLALAFKPRLIVIDTSTPSIHADLQTAAALKDRLQEAFILLVGPHVTALPEATLQSSYAIDAVARGEYDYTVRDVAQHLDGGNDLSAVEGISYRESDGSIAHNADRPFIQDLDELPFVSEVYKRHLHIENYFYSITRREDAHFNAPIVCGRKLLPVMPTAGEAQPISPMSLISLPESCLKLKKFFSRMTH
jgi:anaerobic magnesium-protoporphyrin IX monomethyl ester cyclase